jgi:hypothetical protein
MPVEKDTVGVGGVIMLLIIYLESLIISTCLVTNTTVPMFTFNKSAANCFRLYILPNSVSSSVPNNLQMWLRQDVDNNNDNEFQLMRRKLIHELEAIEQGRSYS